MIEPDDHKLHVVIRYYGVVVKDSFMGKEGREGVKCKRKHVMLVCHSMKRPCGWHEPTIHHSTSLETQKYIFKVYGLKCDTLTSLRAADELNSFLINLISHLHGISCCCALLSSNSLGFHGIHAYISKNALSILTYKVTKFLEPVTNPNVCHIPSSILTVISN